MLTREHSTQRRVRIVGLSGGRVPVELENSTLVVDLPRPASPEGRRGRLISETAHNAGLLAQCRLGGQPLRNSVCPQPEDDRSRRAGQRRNTRRNRGGSRSGNGGTEQHSTTSDDSHKYGRTSRNEALCCPHVTNPFDA